MTDNEKEFKSKALEEMSGSDGGRILFGHIEAEIKEGWEKFIDLPAEKKTAKAAYDAQAQYKVLRDLKEWVASEIKLGK